MSLTGLLLGVLAVGGEPLLDPQSHRSPSGIYVLEVDPSTNVGAGEGLHRMMRSGEEVWSATLPYTLWDAEVADDGSVAGYAYTSGMGGLASKGELRLVILDPQGKPRLDQALPRTERTHPHLHPHPTALGILLDYQRDRVVFRVEHMVSPERREEKWTSFELSTGEPIASIEPKELLADIEPLLYLVAARPVPGTPLTLCQWYSFEFGGKRGARFALIDMVGQPVWTLDLPSDYSSQPDAIADRIQDRVREHSAILEVSEPGRFELALVAEEKRAAFEVSEDRAAPLGWKVTELGRAEYVFPHEEEPRVELTVGKPLSIELLGTIELQDATQESTAIADFDIDGHGRIGVVKSVAEEYRFELLEPDGQLVHETVLDVEEGTRSPGAIWIEGKRWLIHRSSLDRSSIGLEASARAWWLDLPDGGLTPIEGFESESIEKADGTFDGGFVVLTMSHAPHTIVETLAAYDAQGRERWSHSTAYGQSENGLFSPEDIRTSPEGEIGVLDNSRKEIQRFGLDDGNLVGTIDLEEALGRTPYPTDLGVDPEGNWIVYDNNSDPPLLRISRGGESLAELAPSFADGRRLDPHGAVMIAPDGRLWTRDGFAILRLDDSGTVDRVLGKGPDVASLDQIEQVFVDHLARILIVDYRTKAVHTFDRQGRRTAVFAPDPSVADHRIETMAVGADGTVYLRGRQRFAFSPTGEWLGEQDLGGKCYFQPGKSSRWRVKFDEIELLDADGAVQRLIQRKADRTWLGQILAAAVAPDGSLAVVDSRSTSDLSIFSPDGEAVLVTDCSYGTGMTRPAFGEGRIFSWSGNTLYCFELATRTLRSATLGPDLVKEFISQPFWEARSKELWLFDHDDRRFVRYRVGE